MVGLDHKQKSVAKSLQGKSAGDRCPLCCSNPYCCGSLYWTSGPLTLICSVNKKHYRDATTEERRDFRQGLQASQERWRAVLAAREKSS